MKIKFGKAFLIDLEHKIGVLCDTPELREDYSLALEECEAFRQQLNRRGNSLQIEIPNRLIEAVKGEMENMARIYRDNAGVDGIKAIGCASSIDRQLEKLQTTNA